MNTIIPAPIMIVYGTRPEAIKCAPLILALKQTADMTPLVVLTGQHPDMVAPINAGFGIEADMDLEIFAHGQSLCELAAKTIARLSPVLQQLRPTAVMVQGDTTSALAAGLAAFYEKIPVIHIEGGLRTPSLTSPYPEEGNRRLLSQISTLHLAATTGNRDNLLNNGIRQENIFVTGNLVVDALHMAVDMPIHVSNPEVERLLERDQPLVLITSHRRESWGEPMRNIAQALRILATQETETNFIFPLHANPSVREYFVPVLNNLTNVFLVEPLEYFDMAKVMSRATILLTDSGGLQEEGPALGKPVLVLRENTERPEGIAAGTAELVGHDTNRIVERATTLLHDPVEYKKMAHAENPYGDGTAAQQTIDALRSWIKTGASIEGMPTT